ncbi:MAG: hypothetical protein WBL50_10440, partial [Candidatus Acidiferrum sp.]
MVIKENNSRLVGKQEVILVRTVEGTISNFFARSFGPVKARGDSMATLWHLQTSSDTKGVTHEKE